IAGLTGSAIALHAGLDGVSGKEWAAVLYGLLLSVFAGWALGFVTCKLTLRAFQGAKRYRTVGLFRHAQILGAACMAFMHGAQDGQKFMGVLLLCTCLSTGDTVRAVIAPDWLMLLCACLMAAGTAIGGRRIIRSVGMNMVKLEKFQGFSADIAAAVLLLLCSVFALPVSTTHAKTMTILGVGTAKKPSSVHPGTVKSMALTWICTFPGCGLLAYVTARLFMHWF
ncbi:MAG: inorganic phosphate transporter, partial [Clostridia bacterium]|nr:inorganic phosphate transporter [Clostridia bacterium]